MWRPRPWGDDDSPPVEEIWEIIDDCGDVPTASHDKDRTEETEEIAQPDPISQEEKRKEELRADLEWEAMCNSIPGRAEWKREKLRQEAEEARRQRHVQFLDRLNRNDASDMKNLDMLMQHAYDEEGETKNNNNEEDCQVSMKKEIDPRPMLMNEEYEIINFLDAEGVELNAAALGASEEDEFLDVYVEAAADSGAGEHVLAESDAPAYAIEESPGSKLGQNFIGAGGHRMPNKGQVRLSMRADNGKKGRDVKTTFQVAKVTRPLMSVSKICDAGMSMRFTAALAIVEDKNGKEVMRFRRQGGLYIARMKLRNPNYKPKTQPFTGQGARS